MPRVTSAVQIFTVLMTPSLSVWLLCISDVAKELDTERVDTQTFTSWPLGVAAFKAFVFIFIVNHQYIE